MDPNERNVMRSRNFVAELKRRNVYKVAGGDIHVLTILKDLRASN